MANTREKTPKILLLWDVDGTITDPAALFINKALLEAAKETGENPFSKNDESLYEICLFTTMSKDTLRNDLYAFCKANADGEIAYTREELISQITASNLPVRAVITPMDCAKESNALGSSYARIANIYREIKSKITPGMDEDAAKRIVDEQLNRPEFVKILAEIEEDNLQASIAGQTYGKQFGYNEMKGDERAQVFVNSRGEKFDAKGLMAKKTLTKFGSDYDSVISTDDLKTANDAVDLAFKDFNSKNIRKMNYTIMDNFEFFKSPLKGPYSTPAEKQNLIDRFEGHMTKFHPNIAVAQRQARDSVVNTINTGVNKLSVLMEAYTAAIGSTSFKNHKEDINRLIKHVNDVLSGNGSEKGKLQSIVTTLSSIFEESMRGKTSPSKTRGTMYAPKNGIDQLNKEIKRDHYVRMVGLILQEMKKVAPAELDIKFPQGVDGIKAPPDSKGYKIFANEDNRARLKSSL